MVGTDPNDYFCIEYMGVQPDTAANQHPGDGGFYHYSQWQTTLPEMPSGELVTYEDCETCGDFTLTQTMVCIFEECDGDKRQFNIINLWATDPDDELNNSNNTTDLTFYDDIDCTNFACTNCNQPQMIGNMVLHIQTDEREDPKCYKFIGVSNTPIGSAAGGWIEGIGPGTDDFIRVDPDDINIVQNISDNCAACGGSIDCMPICTDPTSPSFVNGPYQINQCDCNGDAIGTQAIGWNSCCDPCDNQCTDPLANNYDPNGTGCCGSGPGIGIPTWDPNGTQNATGNTPTVYSGTHDDFLEWVTTQANGYTGTGGAGSGVFYEDMSTVWYGTPFPSGACVGPNGGTYMWYQGQFTFYGVNNSYSGIFNPAGTGTTPFDSWDDVLTIATGGPSAGCADCPITGVTANTTLNEFLPLLQAWHTATTSNDLGPLTTDSIGINGMNGIPASCEYASYAQNNNCCTYNWTCVDEAPSFNLLFPDVGTIAERSVILAEWNKKYSGNTDFNPSPINAFNHTKDSGYIWPGLEYLNISLRYTPVGNLGFNKNITPGNQGWATGKQPKINEPNTLDIWRYATDFMNSLTGGGPGAYSGNQLSWDIDLTTAYYKVKTNMINVERAFKNPRSKVITETIPGGTKDTGLYYHLIPTNSITIPKGFEAAFPSVSGKQFKTWRSFIDALTADGLPNNLYESNWSTVSEWVLTHVEGFPTLEERHLAAPEFERQGVSYMIQATSGCMCVQDPSGPFTDQSACETMITTPGSGSGAGESNCCACVYGCTDPNAYNYDPLATCDDGSCIDCPPFLLRNCAGTTYQWAYLCDVITPCGSCWATTLNCTNSQALLNGWGFQNFGDVINTSYDNQLNNGNNIPPCAGEFSYTQCFQWVDPDNDQDYLDWLAAGNTTNNLIINQQFVIPNSGLTNILTPYDGISPASTCASCGEIPGCTDPLAINYDPAATVDDGSCEYCEYGCMDSTTLVGGFPDINGYDNTAVYDCAVSTTVPTSGALCPYPCATGYQYNNYYPCATCDDGTCTTDQFHLWHECKDGGVDITIIAPGATWNDIAAHQWFYDSVGSPMIGETIHIIVNELKVCYEYKGPIGTPEVNVINPIPQMVDWVYDGIDNISCTTCTCIYGCTDDTYCNYDPAATCDDNSCCNETGCLDPAAFNYCPTCCCEGPCEAVKEGCMDTDATNYDPTANTPCAKCCEYIIPGCMDTAATNYNPAATVNDGSCQYLNQCKRAPREFGANPTKKLDVECSFASDVYKEYRKQRYGLSNYCGSDLPDHLHEKELCDWEDSKRPAYLSSTITVLDTYKYPIVDGKPDWFDPLRPTWTNTNCGLSSDVDIDMYFAYDTTSMGLQAIQNQRMAIEAWIDDMVARDLPFGGEVYHTLVVGERWLDWGTSVFTGVWNNSGSCGGTDTGCTPGNPVDHGNCPSGGYVDAVSISNMSVTNKFWEAVGWGNSSNRKWYAAMPSSVTNGPLTHEGFPPPLSKKQVLSVNFADEAASSTATGLAAQPYHIAPGPTLYGTPTWTQATDGTNGTTITPCWKADYDKYIEEYKKHIGRGAGYKATMVIYPAKPIPTLSSSLSQTPFPLHVLGGVSSGNNTPKNGRYAAGTAPANDIVDLVNIESANPYWDTANPNQPSSHTSGYGGLDQYGWIANVKEESFDAEKFKEDLEGYWDPKALVCDDSECIVLNVVNQNNVAVPDYDIYVDGGFVGKTDEFGRLLFTIPNASVKTNHIINLCLCLTTEGGCRQQNIKITVEEECAPECCDDPTGVNCGDYYTPPSPQVFEGCTDPNASNYNPLATQDDGSCEYCDPPILITETHVNVSSQGASDGSITITVTDGTLPYTYSWSNGATTQNLSGLPGGLYTLTVTDARNCDSTIVVRLNEDPDIYGCTNNEAGYWPNINGLNQAGVVCAYPCSDDGTNTGTPEGYKYFCYDPNATIQDKCCEAGCTDQSSPNYCNTCDHDCNMQDINASGYTPTLGWDSCCDACRYGCMNAAAFNYDPLANCPDNSCIYYWDCEESSWATDEVTGQGYTLSSLGGTGIFQDTSCQAGFCDSSWFFYELAQFYSGATGLLGIESVVTASELTMVESIGYSSNMGFLDYNNDCPGCLISPAYSCDYPVGTLAGYSFEAPLGVGGNPGSCYAAEQVADFGAGHIFATWQDLVDWHNTGTNSSSGPNINCAGSQINLILPGQTYQDVYDALNNGPNAGGSGNSMDPDSGENWVYYHTHVPTCNGFVDCECKEVVLGSIPGTYPTQAACEADIETCCGAEEPVVVYGCIDNGDVMNNPLAQDYFTNAGLAGQSNQDWWEGQNAANISYAQHNNPMSICANGIIHEQAVANGGSGTPGTGVGGTYPIGIPAYNYNPLATHDDGTCCYCAGCTDPAASTYEPAACEDLPELCESPLLACNDPCASNYNPAATSNDGSCLYLGCLDEGATNTGTFACNGSSTHVWEGVTYTSADITGPCTSCCNYTSEVERNCITAPYDAMCFNGTYGLGTLVPDTTGTGGGVGNNRRDLSRDVQLNQSTTTCGGMASSISDYDWVESVFYQWSNASASDPAYNANNWFWWEANAGSTNFQGEWDTADINQFYTDAGWTAPNGSSGFTLGTNTQWGSTMYQYGKAKCLWEVKIYDGGNVVYHKTLNDGPLIWQDVIDDLYNNQGFDGITHPDVTGLDLAATNLILNTTSFSFWPGICYADPGIAVPTSGTSSYNGGGLCVDVVGGPYNNCSECASDASNKCNGCC